MKKILSILFTAAILLTACKKDHQVKLTAGGTYKVTFTVGFTQTSGSFDTNLKLASADTSVTNNINYLYFTVFNSSHVAVRNFTQTSTDASFGTYTDTLKEGNYTIAVAGTKSAATVKTDQTYGLYVTPVEYADLFYGNATFAVSSTPLSQSLNLQRMDSKMRLVIKDAIPANVKSIRLGGGKFYTGIIMNSGGVITQVARNFTYNIPAALVGTTNATFNTAPFLSNGAQTVYLQGLDASGTVIAQKTGIALTTQSNKTTVLTGNLFGGSTGAGGGFSITLPGWNPPITQGF